MGKSKKTKGHKSSRNSSSTAGPLIDKILPKGLKGLQQTIFWKNSSNNANKTSAAAKMDDQVSTGTLSSQGSAVNVASAAASGSTHNMLPPIILGAQKLNSDSAKSVTSSGYGSLPGSTRNSVIETSLPPVPGNPNVHTSDSEVVLKSSPETSPLAAKKWSVSGYRPSREEPNPWSSRNSRHKMSVVSTYSIPSRPSQSSNYSYTPMTITQLVHRHSRTCDITSPSQLASQHTQRVVINKYEYSLTSTPGRTNVEVRESKSRNRKYSDIPKKASLTNRASIASLPPLEEWDKEPYPRPQRSSYSFNNKTHTEKENNLVVTANRLSITSNNFSRRSSISNHSSETGHRRSVHRISITSVDDGRIPASNGPPAIIEEPVQRPTSKRRYGTIMLESPRPNVIQRVDDYEKSGQTNNGRRESLVVPGAVPQIIFISPTPDPSNGIGSPSLTISPSEQQ